MQLKYIMYSRKSSESKDRQALSIVDQKFECKKAIDALGLNVVATLQESKTAYHPDRRIEFNKMLTMINNGEANAILCWKPDRLSRNPQEGGVLLQMLADGKIKEIRAVAGEVFTQDSDHLILQLHFGMANQYSRNLSQNIKRGQQRKIVDRKQYPQPAFIGYEGFGERGNRNIRPDPTTAPIVFQAFKMASTGANSINSILGVVTEAGLRTRRGKLVSKSHLYSILISPKYYGYFLWNNELHEGNYEPIITKSLFDQVQVALKRRSKPKKATWDDFHYFNGLIHCGSCGCQITTTVKQKHYKRTNRDAKYIYHHCTHRKGACDQGVLTTEEVNKALASTISRINIDQEAWVLGIKLVQSKHREQSGQLAKARISLQKKSNALYDKLNSLTDMRAGGELTKDEFIGQKNKVTDLITAIKGQIADADKSADVWLELIEDYLETAFQAKDVMEHGTPAEKRELIAKVGENLLLNGKRIDVTFKKPYDILLKSAYRQDVLPS